ncbi:MAG: tyrosine--tRNA ligase [Candidatus Dadabacteria bacterium]|nr:tyrosine--tRNA ligase [Candidatus Dadabacteria bacterium]NIQ16994.1 tyrosine--tRNA ligase [Candidatus Dadabacteria bacterium]
MGQLTPEQQLIIIERGTDNIISRDELLSKLKNSYEKKKPLRVKAGFDPTAPDLHLGHCLLLKKLRDFQNLGHEVVFLIGDFTALIGDPTGKSETRPSLSEKEILENAKTYENQVFKILDRDKTEIIFNSKWLKKIKIDQFLQLTSLINIARILEREDFSKRYKSGISISLKEFMYPMIQAYDSVQLKSDIEIGGTDQTFNILLGRDFQRHFEQEPQVAVFLPILEGLDGVKKMSKSLGNYIGVEESPVGIFGKVMSISDDLMWKYYYLLSNKSEFEIKELQSGHPMDAKKELAFELTSWLHNSDIAEEAKADFEIKFSSRSFPDDAREVKYSLQNSKKVVDLILEISNTFKTKNEIKRLIAQGGLSINGTKIVDINSEIPALDNLEVKAGKKEFIKVIIE